MTQSLKQVFRDQCSRGWMDGALLSGAPLHLHALQQHWLELERPQWALQAFSKRCRAYKKRVEHTFLPIQGRYSVPAAGRRGSSYKASWRGTEPVTGRNALTKGNVKHELIPEHSWAGFDCWAPAMEREVPLKLDAERGALRAGSWSPRHNDSMFWKVLDEVYCFFIILWSCVCRCWKCSFASSTTLFCLQIFFKSELQSSFASTY